MKISSNNISFTKTYNPNFGKHNYWGKYISQKNHNDCFVKTNISSKSELLQNSIASIKDILPVAFAGTKCKDAIMLPDFWKSIGKNNLAQFLKLKLLGLSTNKDGYADSFLKTSANRPISTSYVHDCAVMYLYNDKTKTHAIYHAAPNTKRTKLDFIINTLMPEGFTHGNIIPGDYIFYREQEPNLKNMFELMKSNNPSAVVNVFYSITRFPEIVGYKGQVFQIPNKIVEKQMKKGVLDATDSGQASFKILDTTGFNTFNEIHGNADLEKCELLKNDFSKIKFPKFMQEIFFNEIEKIKTILLEINKVNSIDELNDLRLIFTNNCFNTAFLKKKEDLLIKKLNKVQDEESLRQFYQEARFDFIRMSKLFKLYQQKKKEIL